MAVPGEQRRGYSGTPASRHPPEETGAPFTSSAPLPPPPPLKKWGQIFLPDLWPSPSPPIRLDKNFFFGASKSAPLSGAGGGGLAPPVKRSPGGDLYAARSDPWGWTLDAFHWQRGSAQGCRGTLTQRHVTLPHQRSGKGVGVGVGGLAQGLGI